MESLWRIITVFVTFFILINGQADTEKGLVTSLFPGYFDPAMLTAYKGDIESIVTAKGKTNELKFDFIPSPLITNMYPDVANSSLYYMDASARTVSRFDNFNMDLNDTYMSNTTIHEGLSRVLGSLAFDWISKNVYWTDGFFNWIGMQNAFSDNNLKYKVLIGDNVLRPYALNVDPINGYMFWSDMAPSPRIERATLTGENRVSIQSTALSYPNAIALDIHNQTVYFADSTRNTLEAISYSGLNRRIIVSLNGYDFGALALYDNYLCFTEQRYGTILCHDSTTGKEIWEDYIFNDPYGIVAYDQKLQPGRTDIKCPSRGCSDICVDMPKEAKCLCAEGYKLQNDGKTCKADHALTGKGLLFTNGTNICVVDIRAVNDLGNKVHVPQCILANLSSVKYLQADSVKGLIFFWNTTSRLLKQYNLVSNKLTDISTSRTGTVTGLFYDWINFGLYWAENDTQSIKMIDLQDMTAGIQNVQTNVQNPRSLTGDPHKSKLYWISGTNNITIESVNMDRTERKTALTKDFNNPKGLAFSKTHDRLFWIDAGDIYSVSVITADKVEILYDGVPDANTLLPYQDFLMWTSGKSDIHAIPMTSSRNRNSINITAHNNITGICIFDSRIHSKEKGACYNNGGCQHICTPSTNGPVCMCHYGFTLQPDQKSCKSVPYNNNFMLLVDYSHSMLLQIPTDRAIIKDTDILALNITQFKSPVGVAYDSSTGFVYWSELTTHKLMRGKLDGKNVTTVKQFSDHYPDRLTFHQGTGDLFFTATKDYYSNPYSDTTSYIGVLRFKPDAMNPKHLVLIKDLDDPRCLTLYPQKGYIFYGEGGYPSYIGRANMDGTDQKEIAPADIPLGITVDYNDNMVYYCDYTDDVIYKVDIDGKNTPEKFFSRKGSKMADIIMLGQNLYYTGWNLRSVRKVSKDSQKEVGWMPEIPYLGRIDNIILVPGERPPDSSYCYRANDPKFNGRCSTFCLPVPGGRTCQCEEKVSLKDGFNCDNVCSMKIKNGQTKDCTIYPGAVCNYQCDGLYEKNPNVPTIKCLTNTTWSVPEHNICKEKTCQLSMKNGAFTGFCDGKLGNQCTYRCNNNTVANSRINTVTCYAHTDGQVRWTVDVDNLCEKSVLCNSKIPNGQQSCIKPAKGSECTVTCNQGFVPFSKSEKIVCMSNGNWSEQLDHICRAIKPCTLAMENGKFSETCSGKTFERCSFECKKGFEPAFNQDNVCLSTGLWSIPTNKLCTETAAVKTSAQTGPGASAAVSTVGGVLGAILIILIIIIIIGAVCYFTRRREMRSAVYKNEPNVYFNNPPVDENSYSQFNQPTGGVGDRYHQFSNPMAETENAYDMISEKKTSAPDEKSPATFYLKDVEEKKLDTTFKP